MDLGLQNKVVFIAGASRGIGFAIAQLFLQEGARVVITGRNGPALKEAEQRLVKNSAAGRVFAISGDMNCRKAVTDAFEKTLLHFGSVDTVVANCGFGGGPSGWELSTEDWLSAVQVNFLGAMTVSRVALPHLIDRQETSITFISSIVAQEAIDAPLPYSAAKEALHSVVKNLSHRVGGSE